MFQVIVKMVKKLILPKRLHVDRVGLVRTRNSYNTKSSNIFKCWPVTFHSRKKTEIHIAWHNLKSKSMQQNIFRTGFMNSVEMFKLVAEGNRTHKFFRNDYKLILCFINDFQTFIFTGATNCILCVRDGKIFEKVFHRMKFSFSTLISSSFWCNKNWKNLESKWPNHNLSRWRAYCK